jgi:uncharacterized protein YprB with RNaseH-like and TPR domain
VPSLSEKLKSLGVKVGAADLPKAPNRVEHTSLEKMISGRAQATHAGETYVVEQVYSQHLPHGQTALQISAPLDTMADWTGDQRIRSLPPQSFAFLDTETTGLSGGTGTYAFLIGVGRFIGSEFHLVQFFMRDPAEEPAQLLALEEFLAPCQALVTYNGKAFDIPLLVSRYTSHGWSIPFRDYAHIDLLHLSRRLWRDRLPSRTLGYIEAHILGAQRSQEDVPGWMIPQLYFDYLRSGDAEPLRGVFYHNAMDVVSLAALLEHSAALLSDPLRDNSAHVIDLLAIARLYEHLGRIDSATQLYIHGLENPDILEVDTPDEIVLKAIDRLAKIYKRQGELLSALPLWESAAGHGHIESHIEIAKLYEHHLKDYEQALKWTESAIIHVNSPSLNTYQRRHWLAELQHRKQRLLRKLSS